MSILSDFIELQIDLLGLHTVPVWVRRTAMPPTLITEIVKKFGDRLMLEAADKYLLLRDEKPIVETAPCGYFRSRTCLQLRERRRNPDNTRKPSRRIVLTDNQGNRYPISWIPGVIGRANNDPVNPQVVALERDGRFPQLSDSVSRSYLVIDQLSDGTFIVKVDGSPADKPALIRRQAQPDVLQEIPIDGGGRQLNTGDTLTLVVGAISLTVHVIEPIVGAA